MKRIIWNISAFQAIENISAYIRLDSPHHSREWEKSVLKRIDQLKIFPHQGKKIKDADKNIRQIFYGEYRIVYEVNKTKLTILLVRHIKRRFNLQ